MTRGEARAPTVRTGPGVATWSMGARCYPPPRTAGSQIEFNETQVGTDPPLLQLPMKIVPGKRVKDYAMLQKAHGITCITNEQTGSLSATFAGRGHLGTGQCCLRGVTRPGVTDVAEGVRADKLSCHLPGSSQSSLDCPSFQRSTEGCILPSCWSLPRPRLADPSGGKGRTSTMSSSEDFDDDEV